MQKSIYLDYNATTPVDPRVFQKMEPYFCREFGNSASQNYEWGWNADHAVSLARKQVAELINSRPHEIFFTSGATESNNWVFQGIINNLLMQNAKSPIHIISSRTEHSSVINTLETLRDFYKKLDIHIDVDFCKVDSFGRVDPQEIQKLIRPETKLISVIWTNNEIGTINPIEDIGWLCRQHEIYFHTDATQAVGKTPMDLSKIPVDLLSFSGHKIYGPKGVGGLFVRAHHPTVSLAPLLFGGGQENGWRSGTVNVAGVVGLGEACSICIKDFNIDKERITGLRDFLLREINRALPHTKLNGHPDERSYNNINLTFLGQKIQDKASQLTRLGASMGSACATANQAKLSHVLKAIGLSDHDISCTLRLSIGRMTTEEEVKDTLNLLIKVFGTY